MAEKRILYHAQLYADQRTRLFVLKQQKRLRPYLYKDVVVKTRPATSRDYYVPPSLVSNCVVIESMTFGEKGCLRLGCFPFKEKVEECQPEDEPRWVSMGSDFALACAPICREQLNGYLDTTWRDGRCLQINLHKKMVATMPEKIFEREARSLYHGGLDFVRGQLKANERYCRAYGIEFDGEHCIVNTMQDIIEFLAGTQAYRAARVSGIPPYTPQFPKRLPHYLPYNIPKKRTKRSTAAEDGTTIDTDLAKDIALSIAVDMGIDLSIHTVKKIVKKKLPKLFSKAVSSIAMRLALKRLVVKTILKTGLRLLKSIALTMTGIGAVYEVYSLAATVMDVLDVFDFNKFLDKEALDIINKNLDESYFGEYGVEPEITPQYVWDEGVLEDEEDASEEYEFFVKCVHEYMDALTPNVEVEQVVEKKIEEEKGRFNWFLYGSFVYYVLGVIILYVQWLHVWAMMIWMLLVYFHLKDQKQKEI